MLSNAAFNLKVHLRHMFSPLCSDLPRLSRNNNFIPVPVSLYQLISLSLNFAFEITGGSEHQHTRL